MRSVWLGMAAGAIGLAVVAMPAAISVAQDAKSAVDKRVALMKQQGQALGQIQRVVRGEAEMSPAVLTAAETVHHTSGQIPELFKQNVTVPESRAKPEVWSNWSGFEKEANELQAATDRLVVAARSGDKAQLGPALQAVGAACGSCHETFRRPKT